MKNFATHSALTRIVSVVLVVTGTIGLAMVGMVYIPNLHELFESAQAITWFDIVFSSGLAVLGLVSGIAMWRKISWAFIAASFYFLIQLLAIELPNFYWEPTSGFSIYRSIGFAYESVGNFGCGINLFAAGMLLLTVLAYRQVRDAELEQPILE